ncbi:MAG: hypothetical protein HN712_15970 [Gemmatimonadetes bacterium]|nr:hypothetical protein [Gemmatimonadota bacterium]MBT6148266.1 hypothetical protein [Gemmatimonadota bacterium]MBT7861815.1 hypothetical protein [Gemmatimonadota bacterium]
MITSILLLLCCVAVPLGAQSLNDAALNGVVEDVVTQTPQGDIVEGRLDWTEGILIVTGEGVAPDGVTNPVQQRLLGFRAAKLTAYRKLLEVVGGVQVDARTTVSMSMVASDTIRATVEGLVKGATVVPGSRRREEGMFLLDVQLRLLEGLSSAVLPDSLPVVDTVPAELPIADSVIVFVPDEPFTGLVVDARGSALKPSLSPKIIDDAGRVIYSATHVDRDYAVRIGVVGYERDMSRAATNERIGGQNAHPMVVQALRADGLYNSDVVVSRDMGTRIKMADSEGDFLTECRVIFLVGPRPDPVVEAPISLLDTLMGSVPADTIAADSLDGANFDDLSLDE